MSSGMFWVVFLTLISLLKRTDATKNCNDPLQCFLQNLVIPLPDFEADGIEITQLVLKDITLAGLPSNYIDDTIELHCGVTNLGGSITGHYKFGILKGPMSAALSHTTFEVELLFAKDVLASYEVPSGISYAPNSCHVSDMKIAVSLNLGLPHPAVDAELKKVLKKTICTTLGDVLAGQVTDWVGNKLDPAFVEVMESAPDVPVPSDDQYVAWKDSPIGWIHNVLQRFASSQIMNCVTTRHPEIRIPYFATAFDYIIDLLTDGTGVIDMDFTRFPNAQPHFLLPIGNGSLSLLGVSLSGLDSVSEMHILEPSLTTNADLSSSFKIDHLHANLTVLKSYNDFYNETMFINIIVDDITIGTEFAVLVDKLLFGDLYFDQLTPDCLVSTLGDLHLASLLFDLNVDKIHLVEVAGDAGTLEGDITNFGNSIFDLFTEGFGTFTKDMLAGIVQGPLRNGINVLLSEGLNNIKKNSTCHKHVDPFLEDPSKSTTVDWAQSKLVATINNFVNDGIGLGYNGLNDFVDCATNGTGIFSYSFLDVVINGYTLPNFDIELLGMNNFFELVLMKPTLTKYGLSSSIGLGYCGDDGKTCGNPFGLKLVVHNDVGKKLMSAGAIKTLSRLLTTGDGQASEMSLSDDGKTAEFAFSNLQIDISTIIQFNMEKFMNLQIRMLGVIGCEVSTFDDVEVASLLMSTTKALSISNGSAKDFTSQFEKLSNIFATVLPNLINKVFNKVVSEAPETCANDGVVPSSSSSTNEPDTAAENWVWEIGLLVSMCLAVLGGFMYLHKVFEKYTIQPPKTEYVGYSVTDDTGVVTKNNQSREQSVNWNNSIICNKAIPSYIRLLMPILIISTMGLFLASNLDPNAVRVMADIRVNNYEVPPIQAFVFTLSGTVRDMWNAKVYPLSILVAFFSGCWPYVKLAVMLVSWCAPVGYVSKDVRNVMLRFLDAYGKYSLLDFYVMILMLCAFHFQMYISTHPNDADSIIEVDLFVTPGFGFISFLAATLASLVLGHVVLAFHRYDENPHESRTLEHATGTEALSDHKFSILSSTAKRIGLYRAEVSVLSSTPPKSNIVNACGKEVSSCATNQVSSRNFVFSLTKHGRYLIAYLYLLTFCLICFTTCVVTFSFDIDGLAGWILSDASDVKYSVVSVGETMANSSSEPNSFVIRWLQTCFFVFSIAMPLLSVVLFAVLWLGPKLTLSAHKSLLVLTEVVYAWSALDCFCVSIFAALLEITQFAAFIVGDSCDGLNVYLAEYLDTQLQGDDLCFDVQTKLFPSCFLMFFGAAVWGFFSIPSIWYCELAFQDRVTLANKIAERSSDTVSTPLEIEQYETIPFDVNVFGRKVVAAANIVNSSISSNLLDNDHMQVKAADNDKETTEVAPGCYSRFADSLLRFMWSNKLVKVEEKSVVVDVVCGPEAIVS